MLTSGVSGVVTALYWLIGLLVFMGIIFFIMWYLSHNVIYIIRPLTGDRTLVIRDKARIIRKKGQAVRWKLFKRGDYVPVPPKEAIDVTTKGKLFVEAYYTENGEYHYIVDRFPDATKIGSLNPIQNVDKEFFVQQCEEGLKYKKKSLTDILLQIAPVLAVVIILVVFMIFFDDVVQPLKVLSENLIVATDQMSEALNTLQCLQNVEIAPA